MEKTREADERMKIMLESCPYSITVWDKEHKILDCNKTTLVFFGMKEKQEFFDRFNETAPEFQPDGRKSSDIVRESVQKAFDEGYYRLEFVHKNLNGEMIPSEIILVCVNYENGYL